MTWADTRRIPVLLAAATLIPIGALAWLGLRTIQGSLGARKLPADPERGQMMEGGSGPRSVASYVFVSTNSPERENFTEEQRAWLRHSEALWREAHRIAAANPDVDPGDVYHALRCLDLSPSERLRRGLTRVRDRSHLR
ncbi:MAG: hypothetical protein A3H97_22690 [Acidobacteria bacterium RIFCSPLOWO2_02_FULL_65_29]|nr:MAG: hypothetical protein A3H97_22690 [Acidobacteria bacterium RIFCSPLOWO2_02_FULL_65_29]